MVPFGHYGLGLNDHTLTDVARFCIHAQNGPGGPRGPTFILRRINGQNTVISPQQQIRLEAALARANSATRRVQEAEPNYRPRPSVYEGIEGEIAAREGEAREAEARLANLSRQRQNVNTLEELVTPGGQPVGYRYRSARKDIRTVPRDEFNDMIGKITGDPLVQRLPTPSGNYSGVQYRLRDQSIIGLRMSKDNGLTLDVFNSPNPLYKGPRRVHFK